MAHRDSQTSKRVERRREAGSALHGVTAPAVLAAHGADRIRLIPIVEVLVIGEAAGLRD